MRSTGRPISRPSTEPIVLRLDRIQAEAYLDLLLSQRNDSGFLDDADWLMVEMERRGWLEKGDEG